MNRAKAAFFDVQVESEWSSTEYGEEELKKVERILCAASIRLGSRVIEPGCGSGRLTEILAKKLGPSGLVVASDISSRMVQTAQTRLEGFTNVRLTCGTVEETTLEPFSFDAVICHNVFPHFDDKNVVVQKLRLPLKHSGVMVVSHFMNSSQINDLHRKTDPAVANDFLPTSEEMRDIFESAQMTIEFIRDDENGYLLKAFRSNLS